MALARYAVAVGRRPIRSYSVPARNEFFDGITAVDARFDQSSQDVTDLYNQGDLEAALRLHIDEEHDVSHELEDSLNELIAESAEAVVDETASFQSDRRFLTFAVAIFSGVTLFAALLLGGVLSWSLIRPVKRVDRALALIANGDFEQRVEVPNRDEFGNLTSNLNRTTERLANLYQDLEALNEGLHETVERKVEELSRASVLQRYVSPQLAESILSGETWLRSGRAGNT